MSAGSLLPPPSSAEDFVREGLKPRWMCKKALPQRGR